MIKNVTPLLKTNILSLDKSKKPTIRNIFVHILSLMLKKNNTYGHHTSLSTYHWYILYEIKKPHQYFDFYCITFAKTTLIFWL